MLTSDMQLACLAVRLSLDFRATEWSQHAVERVQVERHMRVCLSATPGFTEMVTVSPSEPLLAEAARYVMSKPSIEPWNAASALLSHIKSSYLNPGDRGELVASLLVMLARDATSPIQPETAFGAHPRKHFNDGHTRVVRVVDFLSSLLAVDRKSLSYLLPSQACDGFHSRPLWETFGDARIWFNHFVKLNDSGMVQRDGLCALIARGAAAMCAVNQNGVDLVIPIVFGGRLEPQNVSAILIQVKNDRHFESQNSCNPLFNAMDPFAVKLFTEEDRSTKPVIRMVFTLSSRSSEVALVPPSNPTSPSSRYTAYDIWCRGLTHNTFQVIEAKDVNIYQDLLSRSHKISQMYDLAKNDIAAHLRRSMHPAVDKRPEVHTVDEPSWHLRKYITL